jgi:high affinity sulfate transporter 1
MAIVARTWLAGYDRRSLRPDVVAGITLAAYLLPSAIGDASLAGLPPQAGLYSCLFGGLAFWLFCSSRQTALSVTSAISLLVGATVGEMSGGDPARHATLAVCTALMVGVLALTAYVVRAGTIVSFFSETVLAGFKCGVALFLASTQLPKLVGIHGSHGGDFWDRMGHFFKGLGDVNTTALWLGLTALILLLLGKRFFKGRPVALVVVVGGIAVASAFQLSERGVAMLGEIPRGLPMPALPLVSRADVNMLLPLAMACFVLSAVETAAIGRMFAAAHGYRFDATQEFLAIGSANLAAGVGGGFPVSGGMSQSLVNETAGARTPLSGLVAALIVLVVVLFFTGLLRNLPQPVLAAVVLSAVTGLIQVDVLRHIWRFSKAEFAISMVSLAGVLGSGLLNGVLLGVVLSILLLIQRASRPRVVELARVPGTSIFADVARNPNRERLDDVLVIRSEGSLLYFNVEHVRDRVSALVASRPSPPRLIVLFMGNVPHADLAGAELLLNLRASYLARGIDFRLAETHGQVREALQRLAAGHADAPIVEAHQTVDDVLRTWRMTSPAAAGPSVR